MLYVAVIDGVERQIEITSQGADNFTVFIDGVRHEVNARQIDSNTLSVIDAANKAYTAQFDIDSATQDVTQVALGDVNVDVAVYDLRRQALRQAQAAAVSHEGPAAITTPMPGKIVAVLVEEGQTVEAGQGLVVVEAMKMENELKAPKAGVVSKLRAKVGQAVDSGATLVVVE